MSDTWRATVTATTGPLSDEQRELLVSALPGFPILEDDEATGTLRLEFDVEADSEGTAVGRATRLFVSQVIQDIFDVTITVTVVTATPYPVEV